MGNVLRVLKRDYKRLLKAPAALTVVTFLLLLPSLYTWFNVIAFWDPYNSTGSMRVCVVNEDAGATSDMTGYINMGDMVTDALKENTQIGWDFVDAGTAREAVESGDAYAALVFPKDFTQDLLGVLDGEVQRPQLEYYVNEKVSAVSPKVTDQGATLVDQTINETIISTVSDKLVSVFNDKVQESVGPINQASNKALNGISTAQSTVSETRSNLSDLDNTITGVQQKTAAAKTSLANARADLAVLSSDLSNMASLTGKATGDLAQFSSTAATAFSQGSLNIATAASSANLKISQTTTTITDVSTQVNNSVATVKETVAQNEETIKQLQELANSLPEGETKTAVLAIIEVLSANNADLQNTISNLKNTTGQSSEAAENVRATVSSANDLAQNAINASNEYATQINSDAIPKINAQMGNLTQVATSLSSAVAQQSSLIDQTDNVLTELASTLSNAQTSLRQTNDALGVVQSDLDKLHTDLAALNSSQTVNNIASKLHLDSDSIADFMASPVEISNTKLYPLNNYGSAMAPLFTNLSLWIGAFMLLVILRIEVDTEGIDNLSTRQRFIARFLFMAPMAAIQACICIAGNLFIGVQTASVPLYFFTAIVASLTYLCIEYTLSALLQHVGKGICIVLVFAQITGSTGLYPIEMTTPFFRMMYPFYPFTYGVNAMREVIAGFYQTQWLQYVVILALFGLFVICLGLVLRPYTSNVNRVFAKQIEESDILNGEGTHSPRMRLKLSQLYAILSDRDEYKSVLAKREQKFKQVYPLLRWGALIAGILVPILITVIFSALGIDKVILLTAWIIWVVILLVFLVIIEDIWFSFRNQSKLDNLSDEEIRSMSSADGKTVLSNAPSTLYVLTVDKSDEGGGR